MKIIITGSQNINTKNNIDNLIFEGILKLTISYNVSELEIISGGEKGMDILGELWANKYKFPFKRFVSNLIKYGKEAEFIKYKQMIAYADALIVIWNGKDENIKYIINLANQKKIPSYIKVIK